MFGGNVATTIPIVADAARRGFLIIRRKDSMLQRLRSHALALACSLACSLAFVAGLAAAATPVAPATPSITLPRQVTAGPCIEGICEYALANGLRVVLFPDATTPTVTVNLAYGVGSMHENYGETGMAHLLEHLLVKGTPTHRDIPGDLKKRGIAANATTSFDRTNDFGSFPANDDTLAWLLGFGLLACRETQSGTKSVKIWINSSLLASAADCSSKRTLKF